MSKDKSVAMIRRLRRKFVAIMMTVVIAFLLVIFVGLFLSSRAGFERRSMDTIMGASRRYMPFADREARFPRAEGEGRQEWVPVAVVTVEDDGSLTLEENRVFYVTDEDILAYVEAAVASEEPEGVVGPELLRYKRVERPSGETGYVLVDTTMERDALRRQALHSFLLFGLMAGLFFVASVLLSRWVVKPVETAWNNQRQFVADASHELKTPLTVVLSNADMMLAANLPLDERNARRLDNIRAESQRMKGLVENLLLLARSDSGAGMPTHSRVSWSYGVTCALLTMEPTIFDSGRALESDVADELYVMGDDAKLRQLLDALLDNACKYSAPDGAIHVTLAETGRREATLCVRNEGAPIPAEQREAIFRRFYRADPSRGEESGYGLGLSIAQAIVREHGGKMGVRSDDEHSNTFWVTLPLAGK